MGTDPVTVVCLLGALALLGRLPSLVDEQFILPLADPADLSLAGLRRSEVPSDAPPGRAIRLRERAEVQFALAAPSDRRPPAPREHPPSTRVAAPFVLRELPPIIPAADLPKTALGLAGDLAEPHVLDPLTTPVMAVIGPSRSGRTSTLVRIAEALLDLGRDVAFLGVRPGSSPVCRALTSSRCHHLSPDDGDRLVALRRARTDLAVLVDDADHLDGSPIEPILSEIVELAARDGGFVAVASTPEGVGSRIRGVVAGAVRGRSGIILQPRSPFDGDPLGVRAPKGLPSLPGRGIVVDAGQMVEIQIARPSGQSRAAAPTAAQAPAMPASASGATSRVTSH